MKWGGGESFEPVTQVHGYSQSAKMTLKGI